MQEEGDSAAIEKFSKRTVKVTKEMNQECIKLLKLLGVPVVEAPSEAEAQASVMAKVRGHHCSGSATPLLANSG